MKILFFTMTTGRGGAERVISTLCNNWQNQRDQLFVLTCIESDSNYKLDMKVNCHTLISAKDYWGKGKIKTFPAMCKEYKKYIEKVRPDVIVSFLPEPCIITALMRYRTRVPIIGSERSNPYYQYRSKMLRRVVNYMYSRMDGFVFQTEGAKEFFKKKIRDKATIIGNPLDENAFIVEKRNPRRKEIVSVGRFTTEKNYPMLVNAFSRVHEKIPDAVLRIYGRIDESIGLEKMIKCNGLEKNVELMGEVDNIQDKIRNAGIFVLSSKSEGLPNALMEAMALGIPVIATDCPSGGPKQLIKNGINGLLVENDNSDELANAIITIMNDTKMADELGNEAQKIKMDYGINNVCMQWNTYINSIIKEKKNVH